MASITVAKSIRGNQSEDVRAEILFYANNMRGIAFSAFRTDTVIHRLTGRSGRDRRASRTYLMIRIWE